MKKLLLTFLIGITFSGFAQNLIHHWTFNRIAGTGIGPDYYMDYAGNGTLVPAGGGQSLPSVYFAGVGDSLDDRSVHLAGNFWVEAQNPTNNTTWSGTAFTFWARELHDGVVFQFPFGGSGVNMTPSGLVSCFFDGSSSNSVQSQQSIKDGLWHFVVAQNDGTTTTIYIDGKLDTSTPETLFTPTSFNQQAEIRIGATRFGNQRITGQLDEMRVFDDVLSQTQIDSIYALSRPGADLYKEVEYSFNGHYSDSSNNTNNLQNNNGNRFTFTEDRNANAGDSAVNIGATSASMRSNEVVTNLNWESAALSIWVKNPTPASGSGNGRIVSGGGWALDVDQNGNLQTFFDGSSANPLSSPSNSAILDTNWHHVVAQNNGDTTYLFVDGVLEAQQAENFFSVTSYRTIDHIYFGSGWYQGSSGPVYYLYARGLVDDVKIFSRSLLPYEINDLYQFGIITGKKELPQLQVEEFTVYPNPANSFINLPEEIFEADQIKVFSVNGQVVLETSKTRRLNISDLDEGMYFLYVTKGEQIFRSKFLKN